MSKFRTQVAEHLTPELFRAWLVGLPSGQLIGDMWVTSYLRFQLNDSVRAFFDEDTGHITCLSDGYSVQPVPVWVKMFCQGNAALERDNAALQRHEAIRRVDEILDALT